MKYEAMKKGNLKDSQKKESDKWLKEKIRNILKFA